MIWSYALSLKTRESAHYLVEKRNAIDFSESKYAVERHDSEGCNTKYTEYILYWLEEDGGVLREHCIILKKNAKGDKPFSLNAHVKERINQWDKMGTGS